jgi:hypothetical protein
MAVAATLVENLSSRPRLIFVSGGRAHDARESERQARRHARAVHDLILQICRKPC